MQGGVDATSEPFVFFVFFPHVLRGAENQLPPPPFCFPGDLELPSPGVRHNKVFGPPSCQSDGTDTDGTQRTMSFLIYYK
uniref:Uncharacterized protein n=1 Tax=Anguilla anguilla TaxID=7936 RepID=A0A0E9XJQ3_ANGAN